MEITDKDLLRRYAEDGSQEAFAELVARRLDLVHSAAMRQTAGDFHRAREITQQVFIRLARKATALSRHPSIIAWLYTAVFYEASVMKRAEWRRQSRFRGDAAMNDIVNPEPSCDWSRLSAVLDAAMLELGARDREMVLWRFFEEVPMATICGRLGVSGATARKRVQRALERMRRSLRRQGLESTSAALAATLAENAVVAAPAGLAESVTAKTLAAVAAAGITPGGLGSLLRSARASLRMPAVVWTSGILSLGATVAASLELWTAHREQANLSADEQAYHADQDLLRTEGSAFAKLRRDTSATSSSAGTARRDSRADLQAFLRDYPQSKEILLAEGRLFARQLYGSFFRKAALSPAQIGQMEDAMAERWFQGEVLSPKGFALTGEITPPEDQVRKILGDEACRQFLAFEQDAFAHHWAAEAASWMPGEAALSADQVDQVAQVLDGAAGASLGDEADLAALDWNAIRAQVEARLPAAQWDSVGRSLEMLRAESLQRSAWLSLSNSNR